MTVRQLREHANAGTTPARDMSGWEPNLRRRFGFESGVGLPADSVQVSDDDTDDVPADMARRLSDFRDWCADKNDGGDLPHHAYSWWQANKLYARAKDVDRWFARVHDGQYSTVHIVLTVAQQPGESVAEHAGRFCPWSFNNRLRELLRALGVYDRGDGEVGYAGLKVRAPRLPSGDSPQSVCALAHLHLMLWIEGDASGADWDSLRRKHCQLDGADSGNNPPDKSVSVRVHDPSRDRLTGLPVEVGRNLPCLDVVTDARELNRPYELWCSELRHGESERLDTRGMSIVSEMGAFDAVADWMYEQRPDDTPPAGSLARQARLDYQHASARFGPHSAQAHKD